MDVAQLLGAELTPHGPSGRHDELHSQTKEYLHRAAALVGGKLSTKQHTFLLVPASPAGRTLAEKVGEAFPEINHVRVPGQSDLMFLCEQGCLTPADVQRLLRPCRAAYEALAPTPNTSPHARFDIVDWLPLDP
jgi:hypothetical protein